MKTMMNIYILYYLWALDFCCRFLGPLCPLILMVSKETLTCIFYLFVDDKKKSNIPFQIDDF